MPFKAVFKGEPTPEMEEAISNLGGRIIPPDPSTANRERMDLRRLAKPTIAYLKSYLRKLHVEVIIRNGIVIRDNDTVLLAHILPTYELSESDVFQFAPMPFAKFSTLVDSMGPTTLAINAIAKLLQAEGVHPRPVHSFEELCALLSIDPDTLR